MRTLFRAVMLAATLSALPVQTQARDKPMTSNDPGVEDIAKTPMNDLNVGRDDEIPAVLATAVQQPYSLAGLAKCPQYASAIAELDEIIGPDIDLPKETRERINSGQIAQGVVKSFIPFRGLIRQVSGANEQDRKVAAAIQAGFARRSFLKGVGSARGCKYPAAPATASVIAAKNAALDAEDKKK